MNTAHTIEPPDGYQAAVDFDDGRQTAHFFTMRSMAGGGAFHTAHFHATQQAFLPLLVRQLRSGLRGRLTSSGQGCAGPRYSSLADSGCHSMSSLLRPFQRYATAAWKKRKITLCNSDPIVTFTFDDFPRSALSVGGSILKRYGGRGTYYASMGLMDTTNQEGEHFSMQDLRDLLTAGHELGSHTYSHRVCRTSSFSDFWNDALRGETEVQKCSGRSERGNFAYPGGAVSFTAKARLGAEMRSCRGIMGGIMGPFADLNLLKANRLYSCFLDMTTVERLISENCKRKGWLIFYTHDVRERPSAYGCSPSEFESVVRTASRSGSRILTVSQALDAIKGPSMEAKRASSIG